MSVWMKCYDTDDNYLLWSCIWDSYCQSQIYYPHLSWCPAKAYYVIHQTWPYYQSIITGYPETRLCGTSLIIRPTTGNADRNQVVRMFPKRVKKLHFKMEHPKKNERLIFARKLQIKGNITKQCVSYFIQWLQDFRFIQMLYSALYRSLLMIWLEKLKSKDLI